MRRVRSQFLQSVVGRLGFVVRGRGVSGGAVGARFFEGTGAPSPRGGLVPGVRFVVGVLVVLVGVLAVAPSASAALLMRERAGSFGPDGTSGSTFAGGLVSQLDFSQANDKLFAVVKGPANNVPATLQSFDAPSHAPSGGVFPLSVPGGAAEPDIAVDNTAGATANNLYYSAENTNANLDVFGFNASGTALGGNFPFAAPLPADICGMGVDSAGNIWLGNFSFQSGGINRGIHKYSPAGVFQSKVNSPPVTAGPCHVAFDSSDNMYVSLFNGGVWKYTAASGYVGPTLVDSLSTRAIRVDRTNDRLYVAHPTKVSVYDSAGTLLDEFGGSIPNANFRGIAIDEATDTVYVADANSFATPGNNQIHVFSAPTPVPDASSSLTGATDVTTSSATLAGTVDDNSDLATSWRIEVSRNGQDWDAVGSGQTTGGQTDAPVSAQATGLKPNTIYAYRIVTSKGAGADDVPSVTGAFLTGTAPPRVALTFVDEVTETTARLGAHIDPHGHQTSYRFEWGETTAYGNHAPGFDRDLGTGNDPVLVGESIEGLDPATTYHYRVIAKTGSDTIVGPDQTFETLNDCGLTDGRCYEMVSPPDKGLGSVGETSLFAQELRFQVAPDEPKAAYMMGYALPDATDGDDIVYRADRGQASWTSHQLQPPLLEVPNGDGNSAVSHTQVLAGDLSCSIHNSSMPLTSDAPTGPGDVGKSNLYTRSADGDWTVITNREPSAASGWPEPFSYFVVGLAEGSEDPCSRVVFTSAAQFPGLPGGVGDRLYVWEDGVMEIIATIPGPGGPELAATAPGATLQTPGIDQSFNYWNAVSDDARRIYFTAVSKVGGDVGRNAVFLHQDGEPVAVDVSQSKTATPNNDAAVYQTASKDGSKVFFTARYGLAPNGTSIGATSCSDESGAGCDLYVYSVEDDTLTDLSVDTDGGGAGVAGVLGTSADGEYVYFAARGQLVPGEGKTEAENLASNGYSVYLAHAGEVELVGALAGDINSGTRAFVGFAMNAEGNGWASRVTPDGKHLLYESRADVTGYDSGGRLEAYLYDAESGSTVCVSCRRDMRPSVNSTLSSGAPLVTGGAYVNPLRPPLTLTPDGGRVFFKSRNPLATGAVEGQDNLYQWEGGQVSLIATSVRGQSVGTQLAGASGNGDDVYFTSYERHSWQDVDGAGDLYVARVGDVFGPPLPGAAACDPVAEGGCSGPGGSQTSTQVDSDGLADDSAVAPRARLSLSRLSKAQLTRLANGRPVGLAVRVNRPGRVSVRGRAMVGGLGATVLSASRQAAGAGLVEVPVVLSRPARKRIARTGRLRVRLVVRLSGASKATTTTFTVVGPKKTQGKNARKRSGSDRTATNDRRAGK